jgi:ketosteroid isomerase-like protein
MSDVTESMIQHFRGQKVLDTYTRRVDAKDLEGLAQIAHPDIVLVRNADGGRERRGREAFLDLYRDFAGSDVQASQHMTNNVEVEALADGSLSVKARFVAITTHPDGARMTWGRYDDEIAEVDGTWVFTAKRIAVTRTAMLGEHMLAPVDASSFDPITLSR